MDILLEALNNYKYIIEFKGDTICNNDNINDEEKNELLTPVLTSYEKIISIIDEINNNISMGITHLTIKKLNSYLHKHEFSKDDSTEIKINIRRIKNRYYQQDSRYRKNERTL
jgi:hypothetical protein